MQNAIKSMKITLYSKLKNNLIKSGYEVEEGSWVEPMGYKKPTPEYWLNVTLKTEKNTKYVSHYWFKDNLNEIKELQFWKITLEVIEKEHERIC